MGFARCAGDTATPRRRGRAGGGASSSCAMLSCGLQAKLSPKEHWLVALVVANLSWLPMHLENRDAVPDGACTDARLNQAASVAAGLDPPITPARMVTPELNEGYARGVRWTILAALVKVLERTIAQLEQMIRDGQGDIAAARAALITARDLLAASLIVRAAGAAAGFAPLGPITPQVPPANWSDGQAHSA